MQEQQAKLEEEKMTIMNNHNMLQSVSHRPIICYISQHPVSLPHILMGSGVELGIAGLSGGNYFMIDPALQEN